MSKLSAQRLADIAAYNYCISFIDLLGQKDALHVRGLLPQLKSDEDLFTLMHLQY